MKRLADRYVLTERIATGGMGEVWKARDELLDRDVAVKVLKREYADDHEFIERFRNEAKHAAGLGHPGIAGVFDYGESDGTSYLVMELVRGEPLSALLSREGRLSVDRTLDVVGQAARALQAAHEGGVIHRDVKPGNILVCDDGVVKLTDFGIARAADAVPLTQTGTVMGTAHYLSPEQANGRAVTPASDVYSLGVVAYECLAGRRPFDADTPVGVAMAHLYEDPPALPADVPEDVADLVAQAMEKEPDERFASAAAFATAAEATRAGLSDDVPTAPVMPTAVLPVVPRLKRSRRPSRKVAVIALASALAVLFAAVAWSASRPPPKRTVPPLVGKKSADAYAALAALGLDHTDKQEFSTRYAAGAVMGQDPADGTVLRKGDDVTLTVSRGPAPVTLPSGLVGKPSGTVQDTLQRLGLRVSLTGKDDAAPFGTVIAVSPGSGLRQGDTVTVTWSYGPPEPRKKHGKGEHD